MVSTFSLIQNFAIPTFLFVIVNSNSLFNEMKREMDGRKVVGMSKEKFGISVDIDACRNVYPKHAIFLPSLKECVVC